MVTVNNSIDFNVSRDVRTSFFLTSTSFSVKTFLFSFYPLSLLYAQFNRSDRLFFCIHLSLVTPSIVMPFASSHRVSDKKYCHSHFVFSILFPLFFFCIWITFKAFSPRFIFFLTLSGLHPYLYPPLNFTVAFLSWLFNWNCSFAFQKTKKKSRLGLK